ncbi:MAG TPA: MBOAT family O-acyltransferase, partial [Bacteroidia bacterium]|nr:MBOAT family O-acyltransferase [Bacteroidia bacterium]
LATAFFSYQIYCDFSGYSDIAIGAARVMGFKLMLNFNNPFHSKSIGELWTRWHISLASWFRDYIYIPLGGSRVKVSRQYLNLMIIFLVCGLWHGANWTFVIWGGLQGVYIIFGMVTKKIRDAINDKIPFLKSSFSSIITTFILFSFAAIFFRASSISTAFYIAKNIFTGIPDAIHSVFHSSHISPADSATGVLNTGLTPKEKFDILFGIFLIALLEIIQTLKSKRNLKSYLLKMPVVYRWTLYILVFYFIAFLGIFSHREFIYFQF